MKKKARERMISTRKNVHGNRSHVVNLIMLIEDEMDHAELIIRSTQEHPIPNQVRHFSNVQSAPDYLFRRKSFSDLTRSPRPDVILLDVHLPGIAGIEVLRIIKDSDELKRMPVIMLITAAGERDMTRAYSSHANSYLVKSLVGEEFRKLTHTLCWCWLGNNRSPKI
jgi:CheY-like chemotaxis protein